eukprot:419434-Rhodomonas_salina.3
MTLTFLPATSGAASRCHGAGVQFWQRGPPGLWPGKTVGMCIAALLMEAEAPFLAEKRSSSTPVLSASHIPNSKTHKMRPRLDKYPGTTPAPAELAQFAPGRHGACTRVPATGVLYA